VFVHGILEPVLCSDRLLLAVALALLQVDVDKFRTGWILIVAEYRSVLDYLALLNRLITYE
jgi:hypothetical protein